MIDTMKRVSGVAARLVLLGALLGAAACSLVVEQRDRQCSSDGDCARLSPGSVCRDEVCVAPASTGPDACSSAEPATPAQFLNRCTDAQCIPFDNCARLGLCNGQARPPRLDPP